MPSGIESTSKPRADGTSLRLGDTLNKKRFPLDRLAWITYKGPSALLASSDPFYNKGGTEKNILDCFGLRWKQDLTTQIFSWVYDHGKTGGIYKLEELLAIDPDKKLPREPRFFEVLKAAIGIVSLGKSAMAQHVGFGVKLLILVLIIMQKTEN